MAYVRVALFPNGVPSDEIKVVLSLLVQILIPNRRGPVEITAVFLPIVAFLVRFNVGRHFISTNNCRSATRELQTIALCIGIFFLLFVDAFMILIHLLPKGAAMGDILPLPWVVLYSIYVVAMSIAMYPGTGRPPEDPMSADRRRPVTADLLPPHPGILPGRVPENTNSGRNMNSSATKEWNVKPRWQTYGGIAFAIVLTLTFFYGLLNSVAQPVLIIPTVSAALLFLLGVRAVFQGGCEIDSRSRILHRWWGFCVAIKSIDIPFSSIDRVALGYGLWPGSVRAARDRDVTYHLCVLVNDRPLVVRQGLRDHALAFRIGNELANELETTFTDGTR